MMNPVMGVVWLTQCVGQYHAARDDNHLCSEGFAEIACMRCSLQMCGIDSCLCDL